MDAVNAGVFLMLDGSTNIPADWAAKKITVDGADDAVWVTRSS
jgi:hypothetical protein